MLNYAFSLQMIPAYDYRIPSNFNHMIFLLSLGPLGRLLGIVEYVKTFMLTYRPKA